MISRLGLTKGELGLAKLEGKAKKLSERSPAKLKKPSRVYTLLKAAPGVKFYFW